MSDLQLYDQNMGELRAVGWTPPDAMTYEHWEAIGQTFQFMQGAVNWWIGDWLNEGEKRYGETYAQAIELTGRNYEDLQKCKWVSDKVQLLYRNNNLSWTHHYQVASLEPEEQSELLEWAEETGASVQDLRQEKRRRKRGQFIENMPPLPDGRYRVFYADPPWSYNDSGVINESDNYGRAERHYPTMTIEELCDLGVGIKQNSADDAALFLWVTSPILPECFDVIAAWGFEYKASFVWDKVGHNYGHYNSVRHEFLLICTRGSCLPETKQLIDSVISIPKSRNHSEKPEEFRAIIDGLYPSGDRIELFARRLVPGWEVWGNEASG